MVLSLKERRLGASSLAASKTNTLDDAKETLIVKLQDVRAVWEKDKGKSLPDTAPKAGFRGWTKRSIWFRKMDSGAAWMFQMKVGNAAVLVDPKQPKLIWSLDIAENEMGPLIDETIKQIQKGEWDKEVKAAWERSKRGKKK